MKLPSKNQVHIWQADLTQTEQVDYFNNLLSPDEQQRAAQLVFPVNRDQFIIGRGILRCILARYLNCTAQEIKFEYGEYGKPTIVFPETELQFNLSHTSQLALYAISLAKPVGIDIEEVNSRVDAASIAQRYFAASEYEELQNLSDDTRLEGFFNVWTRKEAIVKALGAGLFTELKQLEVGLTASRPHKLPQVSSLSDMDWSLINLQVPSGNVATLAAVGQVEVIYHIWQDNHLS